MSADGPRLRAAVADDAPALGLLHAICWHETYAELVPAPVLASSTRETRTDLWRNILDPLGSTPARVFVAERQGEMLGFGAWGPQRTIELARDGFDCEVTALYVRGCAQGEGLGTAIFRKLERDLAERGFAAVALWVLRENRPARRFYEQAGGTLIAARQDDRAGGTLAEVAYGWRSLRGAD